jgi:branched-chain amino acid transport system ATP-binding protein
MGRTGAVTADGTGADLRVCEMSAGYGKVAVLKKVSLIAPAGQIVALIGANGAGKSTFLRCIMSLNPIMRGEIWFGDARLDTLNTGQIARAGLALVPEGRRVFASQTIASNLLIGAWPRRKSADLLERRDWMYERFPILGSRRRMHAGTLSGGEAQMLSIAMALMTEPRVLLLDEPSLGLAPLVIDQVYEHIQSLKEEGRTILLVEQNTDRALRIADEAFVLRLGEVVLQGTGASLANSPELKAAYLG